MKDFNIKKEATGTLKPIVKEKKVNVTNHMLEIRLYWAGKGTTLIPSRGNYGPLISAISLCHQSKYPSSSKTLILFRIAFVAYFAFSCFIVKWSYITLIFLHWFLPPNDSFFKKFRYGATMWSSKEKRKLKLQRRLETSEMSGGSSNCLVLDALLSLVLHCDRYFYSLACMISSCFGC